MPRRLTPLGRHLRASVPLAAALSLVAAAPALAQATTGWALNSYGLPGGVETPSAEMLPDGEIAATLSWSDYGRRATGAAQIAPRVTAALRYSNIEGLTIDGREFADDRSVDLRFQVLSEAGWRPAVAIGLQDFVGTGIYAGEYVVATKRFVDGRVTASLGLGWGRLGGATRAFPVGTLGGEVNSRDWFSGDAKPFASLSWQATDKLRLTAEYSQDRYAAETDPAYLIPGAELREAPGSRLNLGATYRFRDAYQASVYSLGGETFGVQLGFALNMRKSPRPSGLYGAPPPVRPRVAPGADPEGWTGAWSADPTAQPAIQTALGTALAKDGMALDAMALQADRAEVRITNTRYPAAAEAIGRTARLMTRALPPSVETFVITSMAAGVPTSSVVLRRSDVERLENTEAGQIAAVAQVVDAPASAAGLVATPGVAPKFTWALRPYYTLSGLGVDDSTSISVGAQAVASYALRPGLVLSGTLQQQLYRNVDLAAPAPLTAPYRVRTDAARYADNDSPTIERLQLAWYAKPAPAVYTRVTAGLLEPMYGGISAEVLYKPADQSWAVGAEIAQVRKRETDKLFSFQDYETTTGHISGYLEFGNGFTGQLDVGRYLARDWGATLTLSREFANGWKIGAYVTKTDLDADAFGEGSFDKGITVSIPVGWALGTASQRTFGGTFQSALSDGGAKLDVDGRLYETVRRAQGEALYGGWGRFWR